jgi:hypothetical protein
MKHLPFEFNGTEITDATTDESGRFAVEPVEHYGQDFINAYQCQLVVDILKKLKNKSRHAWEDSSWHNDLCPSVMAEFVGDGCEVIGYVQIWLPNHPKHNPNFEDIGTYSVSMEIYEKGLEYVGENIETSEEAIKIAKETINKYF